MAIIDYSYDQSGYNDRKSAYIAVSVGRHASYLVHIINKVVTGGGFLSLRHARG